MQAYKNLGGDSEVAGFEIELNSITVQFKDGWNYQYTYDSAGAVNVEEMKARARQGFGLNQFINRYVKTLFVKKWL